MNINQFQYLLQVAKYKVTGKASKEEIKDFFIKNNVNVTDYMVEDFMKNSHKLPEIALEVNL